MREACYQDSGKVLKVASSLVGIQLPREMMKKAKYVRNNICKMKDLGAKDDF